MQSSHSDHEVFDGEPVKELAPDEPRTPGWLPVVGAVLFAVAAVILLVTADDPSAADVGPEPAKAVAAATAAPAPSALSPEQLEALRWRAGESRGRNVMKRVRPMLDN